MEPRIQYARTSDGVSIAYWSIGEGPPLVHLPWFRMSNVELEWQIPEVRSWYQRLAAGRRLLRYDSRGIGMSDRSADDYSLDALVRDLEAVVDSAGLERFALFGVLHTGPVAIAYAARNPDRVSQLVLWCTYARATDYARAAEVQATRGVIDTDWDLYTETLASVRLGWAEGKPARQFAAVMRESITPEVLQRSIDAFRDVDVTALLAAVQSPTLVLHRRGIKWLPVDVARPIASSIPSARLVILEGESGAPYLGDADAALAAIEEFLDGRSSRRQMASSGTVRTVLFTDAEGSTALTERLGDAAARTVLREHERITREALKAHAGSEIKTTGDGFMASFASAANAVECAIAIQKRVAERGLDGIPVRIGLNAGEPIAEGNDLFGTAVNLAARIAGEAAGGEILVSDVVRQLVAGKKFTFDDRGQHPLKGFEDPVRVFAVRWRDSAA